MPSRHPIAALAQLVSTTKFGSLPSTVIEAVKLRILDQLGAALAGYSIGTADVLLSFGDKSEACTYWGRGSLGSRRDVVLYNTFIAHACYMEDGSRYTGGHPACVVIPPAIAIGEFSGANGAELIAAVAVGYEVFLRLGRAIYPSVVRRGFQSTAVLGGISAAATSASLLGLAERETGNALALGAMTSVGYKAAMKSAASQPFQVARAAEGGLYAALLAQTGVVGAPDILDQGLMTGCADEVNQDAIFDNLGSGFCIHETYLKRHGGCRGNHAPIDVIEEIVIAHGIRAPEIERIVISVDTITFKEDIKRPQSGLQAQQSISFAVAASLLFGDASFRRYTEENLQSELVQALMQRIDVMPDKCLDIGFPEKRPAVAEITTLDGRRISKRLDLAKGEPENPMTTEDVHKKFLSLASPIIGLERAKNVCRLIANLETLGELGSLTKLLSRPF